nr:ras-related protein Rab-38 [Mirounga angustirostris]
MQAPHKEHLYKLLVIGDLGVGKTSIIKRYVHQNFSSHYRATIGVDFALKVLHWDPETVVRLQLWDIAGEHPGRGEGRRASQRVCSPGIGGCGPVPGAAPHRTAPDFFLVGWKLGLKEDKSFSLSLKLQVHSPARWGCCLNSLAHPPLGISGPSAGLSRDPERQCLEFSVSSSFSGRGRRGRYNDILCLVFEENINIDEASRCLVKHILANECDLMESIEPDIVKPHLTSPKIVSCSSCAKS